LRPGSEGPDGDDDPGGGEEGGHRIPTLCITRTCARRGCAGSARSRSRHADAPGGVRLPGAPAMKIHTHTRKVRQARRHILDLLLAGTTASATPAPATTTANCSRWRRSTGWTCSGSATREADGRTGPVEPLGVPGHEQVRAVPPVRPDLHDLQEVRVPGGGGPGIRPRSSRSWTSRWPTWSASMRPVHQPVPDGGLRANDPTDDVWRPSTTRRSTW
jgi:hypothetical protein